jgi:hypothetical protein
VNRTIGILLTLAAAYVIVIVLLIRRRRARTNELMRDPKFVAQVQIFTDWQQHARRQPSRWILNGWCALFLVTEAIVFVLIIRGVGRLNRVFALAGLAMILVWVAGVVLYSWYFTVPRVREFYKPRLLKLGICPECGYDLRATPESGGRMLKACPECGKRTTGEE